MMSASSPQSVAARIDRLPASGPVWSWVARLSFGAFFEIYEIALTSLLAPVLVHAGIFHKGRDGLFGLPDLATFAFVTFVGLFVGALLFSAVSDRYGRRPVFTIALIWYALATLVMAGQDTAFAICLWRLVAAIGIGAEVVAIDSYLAELMPRHMRGRGFAISKSIQYTAIPLAGILATVLARRTIGGIDGWRIMLLVPAIGAVLIWWVRRGLPESPRWLATHGRMAEAVEILDRIEQAIIRRTGQPLPAVIEEPETRTGAAHTEYSYANLFRSPLRRRTLMMLVASSTGAFAFFGFSNWLPSLLEARGVDLTKSLLYSALIAFTYPITPFLISFIADRFERKWQNVAGATLVATGGLLFAGQTSFAGWIAFGVLITVGNNIASYSMHTYRAELFPTPVRARAVGLIYSADRFSAAFSSYAVGFIIVNLGASGVLAFVSAAAVANIAAVAIFGPRTLGVSADTIE
jgi:MFS transporter, putative metabolite:H+ symporter